MSTEAVLTTLDDYANAYCARDIEAMMAVFDNSDEISVIGTGMEELCSGRSEVRRLFLRNFRDAHANRFEWDWVRATVDGDFAVIAVTLKIDLDLDGKQILVPLRWTVALRRSGDRWVWIHRHASTSASDQSSGRAYPGGAK